MWRQLPGSAIDGLKCGSVYCRSYSFVQLVRPSNIGRAAPILSLAVAPFSDATDLATANCPLLQDLALDVSISISN